MDGSKIPDIIDHGDSLIEIPNAFTLKQCYELIKCFHDHPEFQYQGITKTANNKTNTAIKNTKDITISNHPELKYFDGMAFKSLQDAIKKVQGIVHGFTVTSDYGYLLQTYAKGGFYVKHHDGDPKGLRHTTCLWYLNSMKPDQGGKTIFTRGGQEFTPRAGSLLIFPANWSHPHIAEEVKYGMKYILTTWLS